MWSDPDSPARPRSRRAGRPRSIRGGAVLLLGGALVLAGCLPLAAPPPGPLYTPSRSVYAPDFPDPTIVAAAGLTPQRLAALCQGGAPE